MGKIMLGRVDGRLIHGQVMTKWSKGISINAIYVVDNGIASDEFMKDVFIGAGSKSGLEVKIYSVEEAIQRWDDTHFDNDNVMVLFKTIKGAIEAIKGGLPVERLNLGGVAKHKNSKPIISSVFVDEDEMRGLKELAEKGVEVFFQTVPDTPKIDFADAEKIFNK